ncbi:MAG TPA: response regulator, partial [Afifellaceae bacterium]|nr:response regulator [Afifellaceae bacterium]
GHLVKPARSSVLLETIITVLQETKANAEEAGQPAGNTELPANETVVRTVEDLKRPVVGGRTGHMILVAEDNEVNQIVVEQILGETGHAYTIVGNGKLAVEQYKAVAPDLILMDVSMPEMNGLEATQAIRELEKSTGAHVPIVGLTAHALKGDRDMCIQAGMDEYVPKPISVSKLQEAIATHLGPAEEKQTA